MPSRQSRPNQRRPGQQSLPLADANAVSLADDQFALELAGDQAGLLADESLRLFGDDNADAVDIENGPPRMDQVEAEAAEELSELLRGFKQREQNEEQRFIDAVDSEHWVALCFQTRAQKEEFLAKARLIQFGDKYIDGMKVAEVLGIRLESRVPPMPTARLDRQLADLT